MRRDLRDSAVARLRQIGEWQAACWSDSARGTGDPERAHILADSILLTLIDDEEITEAFQLIDKYYA